MTRSTSARIVSRASGRAGGEAGRAARTSPGRTRASTGRRSPLRGSARSSPRAGGLRCGRPRGRGLRRRRGTAGRLLDVGDDEHQHVAADPELHAGCSRTCCSMRSRSTKVPFVEPRSRRIAWSPMISSIACWREASGSSRLMSAPARPDRRARLRDLEDLARGRALDDGEREALVLGQLDEAHLVQVAAGDRARARLALDVVGQRRSSARLRLRASGVAEGAVSWAGGGGVGAGRRLRRWRGHRPGGRVIAPSSGFSISIEPPHFAHFVLRARPVAQLALVELVARLAAGTDDDHAMGSIIRNPGTAGTARMPP